MKTVIQPTYPKYANLPRMVADLHILSPVGSVSVPAQVMFPLLIFATLQGFSSVPQIL